MKVYMINSQDNGLEEQVGHLDLLDFILLAFYLRDTNIERQMYKKCTTIFKTYLIEQSLIDTETCV